MDQVLHFIYSLPERAAEISEYTKSKPALFADKDDFKVYAELKALLPPELTKFVGRTALATIMNLMPSIVEHIKSGSLPVEDLFKALHILIPAFIHKDTSRITYFAKIRGTVKSAFGAGTKEYALSKTMMFCEEAKAIRAAYINKVAARAGDRQMIAGDIYEGVFNKINESKSLIDKIIQSIMVSGSRFIEVLSIANYVEDKEDKRNIMQSGIAKKHGDVMTVSKPILYMSPPDFIDMIDRIRFTVGPVDNKTLHEVTNKYNSRVNARIRNLFGDDNITSHTLRAAYGSIAYDLYGDKSKETLQKYLSRVLGHDKNNISTANSYANVVVVKKVVDSERARERLIEEIREKTREAEDLKRIITELKEHELKERERELEREIARVRDEQDRARVDSRRAEPIPEDSIIIRVHRIAQDIVRDGERVSYAALRERHIGNTTISTYYAWTRRAGIKPGQLE